MVLARFRKCFATFPIFKRFIQAHLSQLENLHCLNKLIASLLIGQRVDGRKGILAWGASAKRISSHKVYFLRRGD